MKFALEIQIDKIKLLFNNQCLLDPGF